MTQRRALPAHLAKLGLVRNPFPQTPDADCYYSSPDIALQLAEARHCVTAGKGFVLLTAEVGSGKSTFLRRLMDELVAEHCVVAFLFNTFLQGRDLLLAINRDFGLAAGADMAEDVDRLNRFLLEQHLAGHTCVAVIDDAQNLDSASLELLRLLSNMESRQHKLLQIVLAGQPELLTVLAKTEIRQLASRVVQHVRLLPFTPAESAAYVDFRLAAANAGPAAPIALSAAAHAALARHARGNPRRIHLVMDRCLYGVLASGQREIGAPLLALAVGEVGIHTRAAPRRRLTRGAALAAGLGVLAMLLAACALTRWPAAAPAADARVGAAAIPSLEHTTAQRKA